MCLVTIKCSGLCISINSCGNLESWLLLILICRTVAQTTFSLVETVLVDQDGEEVSVTTARETPYDAVLIGSGDRTQPNGCRSGLLSFRIPLDRAKRLV